MPTTKKDEPVLEAIIDEALREDFGAQGERAVAFWKRLDPAHPSVVDMLRSRGAVFCSWAKSQRRANFLQLVTSFDPMYASYYVLWLQQGEKNLLSPGELALWDNTEWPDPRW